MTTTIFCLELLNRERPFYYRNRTEYVVDGLVSEYLYPINLAAILQGYFSITRLLNWGPALGFLPSEDAVVFVQSSSLQHQDKDDFKDLMEKFPFLLRTELHTKYVMATAFMLLHPYGHLKRLMSSYRELPPNTMGAANADESGFDSSGFRSPAFDEHDQCVFSTGFLCEHRWPIFTNLVVLANYFQTLE